MSSTLGAVIRNLLTLAVVLLSFSFSAVPKSEAAPSTSEGKRCTITGTKGNDVLVGTPGPDVICGLSGNDTINGLTGNDVIDGGSGNDLLVGGAGNDRLSGNEGNDVLKGEAGNDGLIGGVGSDKLSGSNAAPPPTERNLCEKDAADIATYCGFDNSAPWIVSATLSRTSIDSSTTAQTVEVFMHVTDELMGVNAVTCNLLLEGSRSFTGVWNAIRTSGDSIDGTYTCKVVFPSGASIGRYGVGFSTVDKVGNMGMADQFKGFKGHSDLPEIMAQTPEHWIAQAGPGDHESPRIRDVTFSDKTINTSTGLDKFSVQMKVTDDSAGVRNVGCVAKHNSVEYVTNTKGGAQLISGNDKSGIYKCEISLPKNSGKGKWYLLIYAYDKTGQSYSIQGDPSTSNEWAVDDSLQSGAEPNLNLGINYITQIGTGDDELPVMAAISLDRPSVNTSAIKQTVVARVEVKDSKSGINSVELETHSPSTFAENQASCKVLSKDGKGGEVWACSLTVPLGSQKGLHVFSITLRDKVGNRVTYDSQSQQQGFWRLAPFSGRQAEIISGLSLGPTGIMNTD